MESFHSFSPLLDSDTPLYMQVYTYYKELILTGKLPPNTKLPSLRRCAETLGISRTTAEGAYLQLCADGYILSRPKSGYFVTDLYFRAPLLARTPQAKADASPVYDFASLSADRESFDFDLWRRYLKSALRQDERLLSYGEVQGERDLREALAQYLSEKRNVVCHADSIVIGAGVQSLLHLLCAVLHDRKTVAFCDPAFLQGRAVFQDHGFTLCAREADAQVLYVSPSHMNRRGDVLPTPARIALLKRTLERGALLIEDDYDNEFCYFDRPAPALQGLDGGQHVVYIGTFSRLLLPSIRLSFLVLPDTLLARYREIAPLYNQTASKVEQIALCQFIRDGRLSRQIRKVRKLYTQKAQLLESAAKEAFRGNADVALRETGFSVEVRLHRALPAKAAERAARQAGVVLRAENDGAGRCVLSLACSGVQAAQFPRAVRALAAAFSEDRGTCVQNLEKPPNQ